LYRARTIQGPARLPYNVLLQPRDDGLCIFAADGQCDKDAAMRQLGMFRACSSLRFQGFDDHHVLVSGSDAKFLLRSSLPPLL
jgi:hypothetical protein